jgi:hypothetical protein
VEGTRTTGGLAPEEGAPPIDVGFAQVVASAQRAARPDPCGPQPTSCRGPPAEENPHTSLGERGSQERTGGSGERLMVEEDEAGRRRGLVGEIRRR